MRLTIKEPNIKIGEDGFAKHCQLGRAETGKRLSELVERIEDPVVIALDGSWGSGKSFFLQCWTGAHTKENNGKAKVIYFDAFKHDYLDDPLISLVSALLPSFQDDKTKSTITSKMKSASMKLGKSLARVGLALGTSGLSELTGPVVDAVIKSSGDEFKTLIDGMWVKEEGRIKAMEEFRSALQELTVSGDDSDPQKIVIIIDELDRCRPDYALSMLEVMKHFFAVDNVIFVLGVNLEQLENSVKARYGDGIDASGYLQKFITLKLELPALIEKTATEDVSIYYFTEMAQKLGIHKHIAEKAKKYLISLKNDGPPSIRDTQRLLSILVLIPSKSRVGDINDLTCPYHSCIAGLSVIKCFHPILYKKALSNQLAIKDITHAFNFYTENGVFKHDRDAWSEILSNERSKDSVFKPPLGLEYPQKVFANLIEAFLETFKPLENSNEN